MMCGTLMRNLAAAFLVKETYAEPAPPAEPFSTLFAAIHNHLKTITYSRVCPLGRVVAQYFRQNVWEKVPQVPHSPPSGSPPSQALRHGWPFPHSTKDTRND